MDAKKIREDFPVLQQKIKGKQLIYFDNACMSLRPKQVIAAMNEYYEQYPACAGRSIHTLSQKVDEEYRKAREVVAKFIGAKPEEIIFTRNTTEGINLVAHSLELKEGDAVVTSDIEHNSNLLPWQMLFKRGVEHRIVFSKDMQFDEGNFRNAMGDSVKLVSFVHTSNLSGYTFPAEKIAKIAHDNGSLVMFDCAQSVPHKQIDVHKLGADFIAFSGHKMLGPSGMGVLYGKKDLLEELNPFLLGGDTVANSTYETHELLKPPEKFEAGLQNYAGAIGLAAAVKYLEKVGMNDIEKHEEKLNEIITYGIAGINGLKIIGPQPAKLRGGIISFNIEGLNPHDIAMMLDSTAGIAIRSGAHCVHSWFNANNMPRGSARASLYLYNTEEEAKIFIGKLREICNTLR